MQVLIQVNITFFKQIQAIIKFSTPFYLCYVSATFRGTDKNVQQNSYEGKPGKMKEIYPHYHWENIISFI